MILGFDTATPSTAVAVWAPRGPEVELRDDPPAGARPGHAGRLLTLAEEALERAGATWGDVTRLAVGVGPGGFTGLRLGIATARALAQARRLPLVGVSSLEALAAGRPDVIAVIDARRGEAFAAAWRHGERALDPAALTPAALAEAVWPGALAVGDGAVRFRPELERAGAAVPADGSPLHRVSALHVCRLGAAREPTDRDALLPDYRREPDARPRSPQQP